MWKSGAFNKVDLVQCHVFMRWFASWWRACNNIHSFNGQLENFSCLCTPLQTCIVSKLQEFAHTIASSLNFVAKTKVEPAGPPKLQTPGSVHTLT